MNGSKCCCSGTNAGSGVTVVGTGIPNYGATIWRIQTKSCVYVSRANAVVNRQANRQMLADRFYLPLFVIMTIIIIIALVVVLVIVVVVAAAPATHYTRRDALL